MEKILNSNWPFRETETVIKFEELESSDIRIRINCEEACMICSSLSQKIHIGEKSKELKTVHSLIIIRECIPRDKIVQSTSCLGRAAKNKYFPLNAERMDFRIHPFSWK